MRMHVLVVIRVQDETQKNRPGVTAPPPPGYCMAICFYCVALGHMFLLCGTRPYVSIGWRWAICFYYVPLGHMFVLVGCGRGARPYVSIVCVCMCICVCVCVYVYVYMCVYMCVCVCVCVCVTICFHREGTCWRYISSSNKLKLKYTLSKLCVNDPYKAASSRH